MGKTDFAKLIITKMSDAIGTKADELPDEVANKAMAALADGITKYIIDKTQVMVTYKGQLPTTPPMSDPVVADVFKITGECAPPSPAKNFSEWLLEIQNNIISGFTLESEGKAGIVFPQMPFSTPTITAETVQSAIAKTVGKADTQLKSMEAICGAIIDWIKKDAMNTLPGPATNSKSKSVGVATIAKITIS